MVLLEVLQNSLICAAMNIIAGSTLFKEKLSDLVLYVDYCSIRSQKEICERDKSLI